MKSGVRVISLKEASETEPLSSFEDVFVIPTETVYGLAARIDKEDALKRIYEIKGRPSDNPLILHISDYSMLESLIEGEIPQKYRILMDKFWPGSLTLLFPSSSTVSKTITGKDISTVAVRMPKNPMLRDLIKKIGVPLAAPSANTSGRPSPTTVEHVIDDLGENVSLYIDGGQCEVGLESTVLGIVEGQLTILRPGGVIREEIESVLGEKVGLKNKVVKDEKVVCPGQKYRHYSPIHPLYLFTGEGWKNAIVEQHNNLKGARIGLLKRKGIEYPVEFPETFDLGTSLKECTRNLFSGLRALDKTCDVIFIVGFELENEGSAIMDRLEKAAKYWIR